MGRYVKRNPVGKLEGTSQIFPPEVQDLFKVFMLSLKSLHTETSLSQGQ